MLRMIDLWSKDGHMLLMSVPYDHDKRKPMPDVVHVPGIGLFVWVDNARQYRSATVHVVGKR